MKIHRTLPPAAPPMDFVSIFHGLAGLFMGGHNRTKIERELKSYFGSKYIFLVSSGKAGLSLILQSLKRLYPEKNEVLIPAYTCFSVPSAILKAGLHVSLCDIDPSTLDYDYDLLEKSINGKTLCVLATHLFGMPSDMKRIQKICKDKNIFVVEDAAQAMGAKFDDKFLGTIGDVGFFSLGRGKNITCGSGGIIITDNDNIAGAIEKVYTPLEGNSFREDMIELCKVMAMACLIRPSLYWVPAGLPFLRLGETIFCSEFPIKKMSGMKAGLLKKWKSNLAESNSTRSRNGMSLSKRLKLRWRLNATGIPFLRFPVICADKATKNQIYSLSQTEGLGIAKMYPAPISDIQEIRGQMKDQQFPGAKLVADRLLTIPTHHLVSIRDRDKLSRFLTMIRQQTGTEKQQVLKDSLTAVR